MKKLIFLLVFLISLPTIAQQKKEEREKRIPKKEMPPNAITFLEVFNGKRIKKCVYILETDGVTKSYEAKFKRSSHWYSVEFNEAGQLEDIEVTFKEKQLDKKVLKRIDTFLKTTFDAFEIEKIQAQYLGDKNPEKAFTKALKLNEEPDNFELIVNTKNKGKYQRFEMVFDASGNFKTKRKVANQTYDYLIF